MASPRSSAVIDAEPGSDRSGDTVAPVRDALNGIPHTHVGGTEAEGSTPRPPTHATERSSSRSSSLGWAALLLADAAALTRVLAVTATSRRGPAACWCRMPYG